MDIFVVIVTSVCTFLLSYAWFMHCEHSEKSSNILTILYKKTLSPVLVLGGIGCSIVYLLTNNIPDAIVSLSYWHIVLFFASIIGFAVFCQYISSAKLQYIALLALCLLNTCLLPSEMSITNYLIPIWAEKFILALLWSVFAFLYFILNGVDGIISLQTLSVYLGGLIITVLGMLPIIDGCYCGIFISIFLALTLLNNYPASLPLTIAQCRVIGFLVGWMGILSAIEGAGSCFVVLCMYYIYETVIALFKKLSFQNQFKILSNNTFYTKLADAGVSPKDIGNVVSRINMVVILMTVFQIYSTNQYTIPIVAFFMVFWISSKIISPEQSSSHILLTGSLISLFRKSQNTDKEN